MEVDGLRDVLMMPEEGDFGSLKYLFPQNIEVQLSIHPVLLSLEIRTAVQWLTRWIARMQVPSHHCLQTARRNKGYVIWDVCYHNAQVLVQTIGQTLSQHGPGGLQRRGCRGTLTITRAAPVSILWYDIRTSLSRLSKRFYHPKPLSVQ